MNAMPPLLILAEGRKPRLLKAPPPKEFSLHITVAKLLRDHALTDWRWTHIPSGEIRDKRTAVKLKAMGTKCGWPDFILISPDGYLHCIELKRIGAKLTRDQESFRLWCVKHSLPHAVCHTIDEVLETFDDWGCVRIRRARA